MMISARELRWKRFEAAYRRLPDWLQVFLHPWTIPARCLAYFPVFTPTACLAAALFLAYLKLSYLQEQVTWLQVGMMVIAPVVLPALMCYLAFLVVGIGTCLFVVPLIAPLVLVDWWRGRPLHLFSSARSGKPTRLSRGDRLLWDPELDG